MARKFTAEELSETFKRCKVDPKPGHEYTIEDVSDIILKTTRIFILRVRIFSRKS